MKLSGVSFKKGVSFVELITALAILAILASIVTNFFSGFRESKVLDTGIEDVASLLNEARLSTLSSKSGSQYGVHFETSRLVFFRGSSFTEPDVNNKEVILNSALEIPNISLNGGGSDVVFERLTGKTDQYGTITMRVKNNPSRSIIITIEQTGIVGF